MMDRMTPRERIIAAVERRSPDRVPIDIGGSPVTTIIGEAYERLKALLGVAGETRYMKRKSRTVLLDEEVAVRLHADTRPLLPGNPDGWQDIYFADGSFRDEWGVVWAKAGEGHYAPVGNPLREADLDDLARFPWPDPLNPGRTRGLREQARRLHEETDYAVVLSLPVGFVHQSQYLRGYQEYLMDLILNPTFIEALMDRTLEFWLQLASAVLDEVGPYVDVIQFGDDVAFQDRPMVDPKRYRRMIKPRHKQMIDLLKRKSRAKVLYHCCGAVSTLIPDFIDIGVDALNPVQVSAAGMDTARLKAEFGDHIAFWGAIDTSHVLPAGSVQDVRDEVMRRIQDLGAGGGYVVASVHNIQDDVPPENILAMADAAYEFGRSIAP
ncbi:MAG: uroporphyrinogen decarboxylase family protein [Anaerolineae bacterium]|nr:uroporphyrinogen decarboxylase family protein [Anaerolineae bacterium]